MLIRWTTEASHQLEAPVKYIQQDKHIQRDKPAEARNIAQTVIDRIEDLRPSLVLADPER
jgi:hypothetical protein